MLETDRTSRTEESRMANQIYQDVQNNSMQGQVNQFMQNPFQFLMNRKINIPAEYQNSPHDAVQYLLNNGQMQQGPFNKVFSTLQKMGFKF